MLGSTRRIDKEKISDSRPRELYFFLKASLYFLLIVSFIQATNSLQAQTQSVLATGPWFKFSVTNDGVYKITVDQLRNAGLNPDQLDPRKIKLFAGENGMLPQANSQSRIIDLQELAILVSGEEDGRFDGGDFILFFAQGPDRYRFRTDKNLFEYQNNLFTDKNFYFLTVGTDNGKRVSTRQSLNGSHPVVQQYDDFAFYETERTNLLKSGRQWFGEQFDASTEATIRFSLPGIESGSFIHFVSHTMAQSIANCSFKVFFNNVPVLEQPIPAIDNTSYGIKGNIKIDTLAISAGAVNATQQSNLDVKYQFTKGSIGLSVGYLDFFLLSFKRKLALYGDQTIFSSSASLSNATSTFEVTGAPADAMVWNVTDPFNAILQGKLHDGSKLIFSAATNLLQQYVLFTSEKAYIPKFESVVSNQNIKGTVAPQFVIITHPDLHSQAIRLANHRKSKNGITTMVVTTDQIYNEFSGGKQDFTAIRDFLRSYYLQPSSSLRNALLMGRGSYDYKNRLTTNTNLVPVYESRNSLSPLETYSSDDYFAFLETTEGEWKEYPVQDHTMDIGIGRIPAKNEAEAKQVVDKLIEYDLDPDSYGAWRNEFLFVADDGDFNTHQSQADILADNLMARNPEFNARKFFLDNYKQETRASGQYSTEAYQALDLAIRKGALILNYTGHGSEQIWMQERVLDADMIARWKTGAPYPLFVTATCEFGRNDDPLQISSGEKTLLQRRGGAIGLVTTARPVYSNTNFTLNTAFYNALLKKEDDQYRDLGTIFKETKNNSRQGVGNRNFSLLGDPSMKLAMPLRQVEASLKNSSGTTDLKGLSRVTVTGTVKNAGITNPNFSGEVEITVYDREVFLKTKGDENSPFEYVERPNLLFRGSASVDNGVFETSFLLPKNLQASGQTGKASFYALSKTGEDAAGVTFSFSLGGIENAPIGDNLSPQVLLFLGDTTFRDGGTVPPNTKLIARFSDASGISISSIDGSGIMASMDDGAPIDVSSYYTASKGDATRGRLEFPLIGLTTGAHRLQLTAQDTHGNPVQASVSFIVSESDQIRIQQFNNFPNPFFESTQLQFSHSREGEDLEATLFIYDIAGQLTLHQTFDIPSSQYLVSLTEWAGTSAEGIKLKQGIYVAKLVVRSLADGSKNERIARLILVN